MDQLTLSNKTLVIGSIVILGLGIVVGRYTVPVKTVEQKETLTVENKTTDQKKDTKTTVDKDRRTEKKIVEVIKPDGTKETTTTIVEDVSVNKNKDTTFTETTTEAKNTTSKEIKETVKESSKAHLNLLIGSQFGIRGGYSTPGLMYGIHASKDLLGPISVGVFGMVDGNINTGLGGASIGLSF